MTPKFIPHEDFHKGAWLKPKKNSKWYYFLPGKDKGGNVTNKAFGNSLDPEIKSLVQFLHKNKIKTSPSCAGHFSDSSYFEKVWDTLKKEEDIIKTKGLEVHDPETDEEKVFKDENYSLPWDKASFVKKALSYQKKGVLGMYKDGADEAKVELIKKIDIPGVEIKDKGDLILFIVKRGDEKSLDKAWDKLEKKIKAIFSKIDEVRQLIRLELKQII